MPPTFIVVTILVTVLVQGYNGLNDARRLPDRTEPVSYTLALEPPYSFAPENSSFAGRVDITIDVKIATPVITLHSVDLVLHDVRVVDCATGRIVEVSRWDYAKDRQQVDIRLVGHVLAGRRYTVGVGFEGPLRNDGTGFFKTYYTTNSGEKKWLAATQFQTTHARSAFPCYDEPSFRTPFNVSIKRKSYEIALSNMPISHTVNVTEKISENSSEYRNMSWVYFEQTPPMSTCLIAYFVGEFEHLENDRKNLNVYSHLGNLYQTEYASKMAPGLLKVMERYTGIEYGLPKLDLLALPELGLGAMENWGLNIYQEQSIFVDRNTKTKTKMSVKMMMEHVMSHQWFGNVVTPVWWSYAWLNEGFATYFEYLMTATLEPEWRLEHFFVVDKHQTALEYDQMPKHPLSGSVSTIDEIDAVFDKISYNKGAAVLRMLNNWVGEDVFKKALNLYLTRNKYSVVEPEHLWNAFDNALFELSRSNLHSENVQTIMNSWTDQAGYPVVNVMKSDDSLILTQKRFTVEFSDVSVSNISDSDKWFIHSDYVMNFSNKTKNTKSVWLDPTTNETIIPINDGVRWYIFNTQSTGFYRVNYDENNWFSLIEQLKYSAIDVNVLNRAQLIDDSFNLARAGQLNYTIPLSLLKYLENETDVIPWFSAMNSLDYVLDRMRRSELGYLDVKDFASRLAGVAFQMVNSKVIGHESSRYPDKIGLDAFSTWACRLDNENCLRIALSYYRRWKNGEPIPADIKDAAFCTAVRLGSGDGNWAKMLDLYNSTKTNSERESALRALACTEDEHLLTTLLKSLLENHCPIRPQDYEKFFGAMSSTSTGITALTSFLLDHLTDIVQKVHHGASLVTSIYTMLASKVSTEVELQKMAELMSIKTPVELRNKFSAVYYNVIGNNENWFYRNSVTIRELIKPGSTVIPDISTTTRTTTNHTDRPGTNHSTKLYNYSIILQIIALSVSAKLMVYIFN